MLAGGGSVANQKYVKPSELSLDLIMPSSIRGATKPPQPYHGSHLYSRQANNSSVNEGGASGGAANQGPNLGSFNNLRTPQNQAIGMLQPIHGSNNNAPQSPTGHHAAAAAHHLKKKELQNILNSHDQSYQSLQQSLNIYKSGASGTGQSVGGKYHRN